MKSQFNKKKFVATVLLVLLCNSFIGVSVGAVETFEDVDSIKVLNFIRDIFQVDIDKYDVTLSRLSTRPLDVGVVTSGYYNLVYSDSDNSGVGSSVLTVGFTLWDSELVACDFRRTNFDDTVIHYIQKPENNLCKTAIGVLQRYQTYAKDKQIPQMVNLLKTADLTNDCIKTNNNLQLTVTVSDRSSVLWNDVRVTLRWSNTVNGADYSRLTLTFKNGELIGFGDDRAFYVLGSGVVKISEKQAVNIVLEQMAGLSYTVDDEVVSGFNIINERIQTQPSVYSLPSESFLVKYPIWIVDLPLADIYPGTVSSIRVLLWADTGEIISGKALGSTTHHIFSYDLIHEVSPLQDSGLNSDSRNTLLVVYFVGVCLAIMICIVMVVVVFKRRSESYMAR
ncbi:MAG: hypothetical protein FWD52_02710 [Candidatus Bathyarchaeota archaeon]|nr:hypothetical protein [Candidatus Termiticorpusculum sp.]